MSDDKAAEELRALREELKDLGKLQRQLSQRLEELEALLAAVGDPTRPSGVLPNTGDIVAPRHRDPFEEEPED